MSIIISDINALETIQTKREKIREQRLVTPDISKLQNIILISTEQGAQVEYHRVDNSESLYFLEGEFQVTTEHETQILRANSLCYFPPGSSHGLQCVKGPGQFLVIFAPSRKSHVSESWLQTLYAEGWKQYIHEDSLSQTRNNLFIGIQAALITILTGVSGWLIKMKPITINSNKLYFGLGILGLIVCVFAIFATRLTAYWKSVTRAGRAYLNLRWASIRSIEEYSGLEIVNLAKLEDEWKNFLKNNPCSDFSPFSTRENLKNIKIPPKPEVSGWNSIIRTAETLTKLWYFFLVIGVFLIGTMIMLWFVSV